MILLEGIRQPTIPVTATRAIEKMIIRQVLLKTRLAVGFFTLWLERSNPRVFVCSLPVYKTNRLPGFLFSIHDI